MKLKDWKKLMGAGKVGFIDMWCRLRQVLWELLNQSRFIAAPMYTECIQCPSICQNSYTVVLKGTGCDDVQFIRMEQRCDQLSNCRYDHISWMEETACWCWWDVAWGFGHQHCQHYRWHRCSHPRQCVLSSNGGGRDQQVSHLSGDHFR